MKILNYISNLFAYFSQNPCAQNILDLWQKYWDAQIQNKLYCIKKP